MWIISKAPGSWARGAGAQQGGPRRPGANICPKHPVWPLSHAWLSHLAQVSCVLQKAVGDNEILSPRCSSPNVHSHEGPGRGESWTRTGQVQRGRRLSCPHADMKFQEKRDDVELDEHGVCSDLHYGACLCLACARSGPGYPAISPSHWRCIL